MEFKQVINEMKEKGLETAIIKRKGGMVYSTFAMEDPSPYIVQYIANNAQLIMSQIDDDAKEIEITFEGKLLVLIPMDKYILIGIIKNKEDKKLLHNYANSIVSFF